MFLQSSSDTALFDKPSDGTEAPRGQFMVSLKYLRKIQSYLLFNNIKQTSHLESTLKINEEKT